MHRDQYTHGPAVGPNNLYENWTIFEFDFCVKLMYVSIQLYFNLQTVNLCIVHFFRVQHVINAASDCNSSAT